MSSVIIKRTSPFSGEVNTMELPLTEKEFIEANMAWEDGQLIQHAFPMLTPEQREFIKTGITPEEWNNTFGG